MMYLGIQGSLELQHVCILLWVDIIIREYHWEAINGQSEGGGGGGQLNMDMLWKLLDNLLHFSVFCTREI